MSNVVTTPIFVFEGSDAAVYLSVADAERHLEVEDVDQNTYAGFDGKAHPLTIKSDQDAVIIAGDEGSQPEPQTLERLLRTYLISVGESDARDPTCDLACLVNLSQRHAVQPPTVRGMLWNLRRRLRGS